MSLFSCSSILSDEYLLNICYLPDIVLGTENKIFTKKPNTVPTVWISHTVTPIKVARACPNVSQ
jgi:hypothetical protein